MAAWIENTKFRTNENDRINNFDNIIVTHDLQDCIDESLDRVFGQLPVINYSKFTEEPEKSEHISSKEKIEPNYKSKR